jgi:hypothetical protein
LIITIIIHLINKQITPNKNQTTNIIDHVNYLNQNSKVQQKCYVLDVITINYLKQINAKNAKNKSNNQKDNKNLG